MKDQVKMAEPVFTMLYAYRNMSFKDAVLEILESILKAALEEQNGVIFSYFLKSPPPSYISTNYWEWLEPYVIRNIEEDCASNFSQSTERYMRILQLMQQVKEKHSKVLTETADLPESYIIWSTPSKQDTVTKKIDSKQFHVILQEFSCMISKSSPNPAQMTNDNIDKVERMGWNYNQPVIVPKSSKKERKVVRQQKFNRGRGRRQGQVHKP